MRRIKFMLIGEMVQPKIEHFEIILPMPNETSGDYICYTSVEIYNDL